MQNTIFSRLFAQQDLIVLKEVDSTNSYLKEALAKSTPLMEGTVIMAERQWAGRGQGSNEWHSEPGLNLTVSVLLNPDFLNVDKQFDLNIAISLALKDLLSSYAGDAVRIKWPNDLYIGKDKVAGILIENIVTGSSIKHAIVGIGLNVNQVDFSSDLRNVTSLRKYLQKDYKPDALLAELCTFIEARYLSLKAGGIGKMTREYVGCLYLFREWSFFQTEAGYLKGRIVGVSPDGKLAIETGSGIRTFANKEVSFLNT